MSLEIDEFRLDTFMELLNPFLDLLRRVTEGNVTVDKTTAVIITSAINKLPVEELDELQEFKRINLDSLPVKARRINSDSLPAKTRRKKSKTSC